MNYLSNYYKNLAEQLQEKVNHLTQLIENQTLTPDNHDGPDAGSKGSSAEVATWAQNATYLEQDPGFHDDVVHAISQHVGASYPHINDMGFKSDKNRSIADIKQKLHINSPKGGYKNFDNAMGSLYNIATDQQDGSLYNKMVAGVNHGDNGDSNEAFSNAMDNIHFQSIQTVADRQKIKGTNTANLELFNKKSSN